jgi:hypothetical protein
MPRNCFFGDGSPIPDESMAHVLATYRRLESAFRWERGDVLAVDNIAMAHARNPFTGDRRLYVALGGLGRFADLRQSPSASKGTAR